MSLGDLTTNITVTTQNNEAQDPASVSSQKILENRLIKWYLRRRGVPEETLAELDRRQVDSGFWEFLLKFLVEFGLPTLLEFLKRLLDDKYKD